MEISVSNNMIRGTNPEITRFVPILITDRKAVGSAFAADVLCRCGVRMTFPSGRFPSMTTACPGCVAEMITYEED